MKLINAKQWKKLIVSLAAASAIVITRPFQMTTHEAWVFGIVVLVIIWWASELVDKVYPAMGLLAYFLLFTETPAVQVFTFPLSSSFILIVSSFLLSRGIMKTGVARRLANRLIVRRCRSTRQLLDMTFLIGFALSFLIPHPFSRVILLTGIYLDLLRDQGVEGREVHVLMFAMSASSIYASMFLINGDVILNDAAIRFAGLDLNAGQWIRTMTAPSLLSYLAIWLLFRVLFGRTLTRPIRPLAVEEDPMDRGERRSLLVMGLVVLLWFTEGWHGIGAAMVALTGVVLMVLSGILSWRDHRAMHYKLMVLMTAIFAIGKVLVHEGVAQKMSAFLLGVFPDPTSFWYLPVLLVGVMAIHMMIGSPVATLSVIMVPVVSVTQGVLDPLVVSMLLYLLVNNHFILPIHQTVLLVGYGERHFTWREVAWSGLWMTFLVIAMIYAFFLPWWRLMGWL